MSSHEACSSLACNQHEKRLTGRWLLVVATVALVSACTSDSVTDHDQSELVGSRTMTVAQVEPAAAPVQPTVAAARPADAAHADPPGIHHYRRWSDHLGQGGQPEGDEAFATLAKLGFKTVVSVDGAAPDVEGAARHGLSYVHVPIGYDGIAPEEQMQIVKAVHDSAGPVFIHCHHGLHRGPAAAAIGRITTDGVSPQAAHDGLKESGCSPDYTGLYRDVLAFKVPDPAVLAALPAPPSQVRPKGLRAAMVDVDDRWDLLKASKDAAWKTPAEHPDVVPAREAMMLRELLHEVGRLEEASALGAEFLALLTDAETKVAALESAAAQSPAAADAAFADVKKSCASCHTVYRDRD